MGELMSRRTFLQGLAVSAGGLALAGCTGSGTASGAKPSPTGTTRPTLRLSGGDNGFPSPFAYARGPGYWLMSYIYDSLLWKDDSGRLLPWLASSYTRSPDGLNYSFQLRPDVHWQDGTPLTSDDVVFTFNYFASQTLSPQLFVRPQGVSSVTATGSHGVDIRLSSPIVTFEQSVAGALPIVPKHIWSSIPDAFRAQDPKVLVGSGPYRLTSYVRGQGTYLYTANNQYFLGQPFVRALQFRPVGDELTALLAGALDGGSPSVNGATKGALGPFRSDPSFEVLKGTDDFTIGLYWNLAKGGALADARFRQACCRAINRADIVSRLLEGNGAPGNPGFLPPTHPYYFPVEQYPFDPAAANRALDQAGYVQRGPGGVRLGPDGKPLSFAMITPNNSVPANNSILAVADIVVGSLRSIGVDVVVQPLDVPTLDARTVKGNYEMAMTNYGGLGQDPDYLRQIYSSKVPKRFQSVYGYANPEFDQLAAQQLVTLDQAKRRPMIDRMQQIVAQDVPLLPLYYPVLFYLFKKSVFDQWYFTPGGFAGAIPTVFNKQVFVTGRKMGLAIR